MKKCSKSLAIKEMQSRMQTKDVGKDLGKKEPSYISGGNVN
jgi:hypothetical protein